MKITILIILSFFYLISSAQEKQDSINTYKKKVLEAPEIDLLMSYYTQEGDHSAVSGGIGDESLDDITPTIVITLPLNDDDVLTIDTGLSAYSSASSSNINPFGRSGGGGNSSYSTIQGSPWVSSSGASKSDALFSLSVDYSHSSDNRNFIWGAHAAYSQEFDYHSIGFGGNIARLFNEKNTEISLKTQIYLDQWKPIYPIELNEYSLYGDNFQNTGNFNGVTIFDESGNASTLYHPDHFSTFSDKKRNSYSASVSFSQIFSKRLQASFFFDLIYQKGLLATPYHRIYFADKENYYIGNANSISNYTSKTNTDVYRLADNTERLPNNRFKTPLGVRVNYYINEIFKLRSYYRYYTDDWGIDSHTASLELPVSLSRSFTVTPSYRYYTQTATRYFAPFEQHISTEEYYTSDYDLSNFHSNQWGIAFGYTDIFTQHKISRLGLKNVHLKYSHYNRNDGLKADIVSLGIKFVFE